MKHTPQDGDYLEPDGWCIGENITSETDTFTDNGWPGCAFRVPCKVYSLGINIKVTGKPHYLGYMHVHNYRSRCKIEFVGDCEPSTFSGGWLYHGLVS